VLDVIDNAVRWAVPRTDRSISNENTSVQSLE